jgi:D-sedoheptulose 7-phosphate isomerase
MKHSELIVSRLKSSMDAFGAFINNNAKLERFSNIVDVVAESMKNGGRLYIAGNGGSAADAQHLAAEFVCRFGHDRNPLPAEALTADTSTLTAIGNDYGFHRIFSRQLMAKMKKEDVFLAITTSGASENILEALRFCHDRGFNSIVLTGKDGGAAASLAGLCLIADGAETGVIQELHTAIEHALCACVEKELCP